MSTEFILNMLTFMVIYSFFGWALESIYKSFLQKEVVNSGFLKGPLCPIYGFGAIIMILCLETLKDRPILLFVVSFFVLSILEYIVGIFLEKIFKQKYWDYTECKFNIQGRVCLKNSIYWGILGVIFIKYMHPFIAQKIELIPTNILICVISIIYIAIIIDTITTIMTIVKFDEAIKKINELGEKIKLTLEELKVTANSSAKYATEKLIQDLKMKETKLKLRVYKEAKRLKLAFPTMKSDKITQFLNQKIDFETLKRLIKKDKE